MAYELPTHYRYWYRQLLRLYPTPFYARFAEGMEQTFNDKLRDRAHEGGNVFFCALWMFVETFAGIFKQQITYSTMTKSIIRVGLVTLALLMIPFIGMQVGDDWNWSAGDFIFATIMIFGTGILFEYARTKVRNPAYTFATALALASAFLLIWINGAVGIIGNEDNPLNLLYLGVIVIGIIGAFVARFRAFGMSRVLFVCAAAQALVPVVAFIIGRPSLDELPGIAGVFFLSFVFAAMMAGSALLYRQSVSPVA